MQKIPVFVISLKDAARRREAIAQHLSKLNIKFEFHEAVVGKILSNEERKKFNPNGNMSPGVLGCYLSHIKLYEKIVASQISLALVLEDDVVLHNSASLLVENGVKSLNFDYCFLLAADRGDQGDVYFDSSSSINLTEVHKAYPLSSTPYCTGAYLITLEGAKKRLNCGIPARTAIDHYGHLPYLPTSIAIIPLIGFMNEQATIESLTSINWTGLHQTVRKYPWFYPVRDFLKLKTLRRWLRRFARNTISGPQWRSFSSSERIVPLKFLSKKLRE